MGVVAPFDGGRKCGALREVEKCNVQRCVSVDCRVGAWDDWGRCSVHCNGGTHSRSRSITQPALHGGATCAETKETRKCNTQPCMEDGKDYRNDYSYKPRGEV